MSPIDLVIVIQRPLRSTSNLRTAMVYPRQPWIILSLFWLTSIFLTYVNFLFSPVPRTHGVDNLTPSNRLQMEREVLSFGHINHHHSSVLCSCKRTCLFMWPLQLGWMKSSSMHKVKQNMLWNPQTCTGSLVHVLTLQLIFSAYKVSVLCEVWYIVWVSLNIIHLLLSPLYRTDIHSRSSVHKDMHWEAISLARNKLYVSHNVPIDVLLW